MPANDLTDDPLRMRRMVPTVAGVFLVVAGWGFALVLLVGFLMNPAGFGRTLANGLPTWPFQILITIIVILIGVAGLRLLRVRQRRARLATLSGSLEAPQVAQSAQSAQATQATQTTRVPAHTAPPGTPPGIRTPHTQREPLRTRFAAIMRRRETWISLLLILVASAALLAGMMAEWMGPGPQGMTGAPVVLAFFMLLASLIINIAALCTRSRQPTNDASAGEPNTPDGDARAPLLLLWWPITVVSVLVPLFLVWVIAVSPISDPGLGLPIGICFTIGVFGFSITPWVIDASIHAFRGRGLRGFWRAARNTPWGDGFY